MCYPCDRGIVLPICPGYTNHSPGIHPEPQNPSSDNGPWRTYYDLGGSSGHLDNDVAERWDIAKDNPDVVGRIKKAIERYEAAIAR